MSAFATSILFAHVTGKDRAWIIAHGEETIDDVQRERFLSLRRRLALGEPVAYLTGTSGFYGREFAVDPNVLIPRRETEHLVEAAIEYLHGRGLASPRVLEAGVGSGAIACTIACEVPNAFVHGTEISPAALDVARLNAERFGVRDRCLFELANVVPAQPARYDLIVANLPYVPSADVAYLPTPCRFEPRVAFDGGLDGLDAYRTLLAAAPALLSEGGLLLMEAAPPTIHELQRLCRGAFPNGLTSIERDYGGLERYVSVSPRLRSGVLRQAQDDMV